MMNNHILVAQPNIGGAGNFLVGFETGITVIGLITFGLTVLDAGIPDGVIGGDSDTTVEVSILL